MTVVFECLNCFLVGCCWVAAAVAARKAQNLPAGLGSSYCLLACALVGLGAELLFVELVGACLVDHWLLAEFARCPGFAGVLQCCPDVRPDVRCLRILDEPATLRAFLLFLDGLHQDYFLQPDVGRALLPIGFAGAVVRRQGWVRDCLRRQAGFRPNLGCSID